MYNEELLSRVIELFGTMTEADEITEDSEIMEDLEVNSMDVLFLISSLEAEFGVKVPEKAIRKMVTVGDVVEIVEGLLK